VLDHLAVLEAPDVDVFDRVCLARRRLSQELAEVAPVDCDPGDDLVALADLVLDLCPQVIRLFCSDIATRSMEITNRYLTISLLS
jgi:hypothetical protein